MFKNRLSRTLVLALMAILLSPQRRLRAELLGQPGNLGNLATLETLVHALYPEFAKIMWNFAKRYSRDQKAGAIKYNPYKKSESFSP
jgi:hypothetical protein